MAATRDRNAVHPTRAAAWAYIEHLALQAKRHCARLYLHAGDQADLHTTGRPHATVRGNLHPVSPIPPDPAEAA